MTKMEIDFTDEQLEEIKRLEAHGIGVGDAIDMLFEARDKVMAIMDEIDEEKLHETGTEDAKPEEVQETTGKTYDVAVEDMKSHISWAKDFFKI